MPEPYPKKEKSFKKLPLQAKKAPRQRTEEELKEMVKGFPYKIKKQDFVRRGETKEKLGYRNFPNWPDLNEGKPFEHPVRKAALKRRMGAKKT